MYNKEHKVLKELRGNDVKKILSDHMKSLGYKALQGHGGDIGIRFIGSNNTTALVENVEFEVQDHLNPEPKAIYIDKKEAIKIIAKKKGIDLKTSTITLT